MRASTAPRAQTAIQASAVARPIAALLRGPAQPARVVGVYPMAAYLAVGTRLVAVTARDAERLPFGVQVPALARRAEPLLGLAGGASATLGAGAIAFESPGVRIECAAAPAWDPRPAPEGVDEDPATVRARACDLAERLAAWTRPDSLAAQLEITHGVLSPRVHQAIPRPILPSWCRGVIHHAHAPAGAPPAGDGRCRGGGPRAADAINRAPTTRAIPGRRGTRPAHALLEVTDYRPAVWAGLGAFARAVRAGDAAGVEQAARALVGLGPGLTPAADDVLGGLLAAGRFVARLQGADGARWRWAGRIVRRTARGRTTAVSEALLAYASVGMVGESVGALLRALGASSAAPLERALGRTLALGHTSGADVALGVLLGARLALDLPGERAGGRWEGAW